MSQRAKVTADGAWNAIQEALSDDGLAHMLRQMEEHRG
jgi:hypothetical protein